MREKGDDGGCLRRQIVGAIGVLVFAAMGAAPPAIAQNPGQSEWIGTWAASPQPVWGADFPVPLKIPAGVKNQTVRQIAHVSIGGKQVRVLLSNEYGTKRLLVGAAHVALAGQGAAIVAGSDRTLSFGGQNGIAIPPGAPAISDPVDLDVPPLGDLAISLFLPEQTPLATVHWEGVQTAYISGPGDFTGQADMQPASTMTSRAFLSEILVDAAPNARAVVTFGDSITDGANSTPNANRRWPDVLAARLVKAGGAPVAVLNEGISGDRVLRDRMGVNALARFDQDVLSQAHADTVILLMGINDIGWPGMALAPSEPAPTAYEIIEGYKQLIARAHTHGLRIIGATLTPFEGAFKGTPFAAYYSAEKEQKRQAVNQFIRSSGAFDGVIDFDAVARDPNHPSHLASNSGTIDNLHPGDAGYKAMADAIDLVTLAPHH